jgi:hypothetical protein
MLKSIDLMKMIRRLFREIKNKQKHKANIKNSENRFLCLNSLKSIKIYHLDEILSL